MLRLTKGSRRITLCGQDITRLGHVLCRAAIDDSKRVIRRSSADTESLY
jgi:hypothetical protein